MDRSPDVEVIFEFNGTRLNPANDGYRPAHLVTDNYLTTGIHHYYGVESVPPNGTAKGTITFITPEAFMAREKDKHTRGRACSRIRNRNQGI